MKVIKRNGDTVEFDYSKIIKALKAAYAESNISFEVLPEHEETLVKAILKTDSDTLNVEDIQDLVEQYLMTAGELPVLKAFILYREKHKEARFITNRIDGILSSEDKTRFMTNAFGASVMMHRSFFINNMEDNVFAEYQYNPYIEEYYEAKYRSSLLFRALF